MEFANRALTPLSGFAIQLNKNSFGLACANQLQIALLQPSQSVTTSLALNTAGQIMKMSPINTLQVAIKNNIDVFYFSVAVPMHVYFSEEGEIDKRLFLNTWKEIPEQNESQFQINALNSLVANTDELCNRLRSNNVFTIAKRNVEGQDMLYQSIKLTNGIWILCELKISPGNPLITVCFWDLLSLFRFRLIYILSFSFFSFRSRPKQWTLWTPWKRLSSSFCNRLNLYLLETAFILIYRYSVVFVI